MLLGCEEYAQRLGVPVFFHQPFAQIVRLIQQHIPFKHVAQCLQFQERAVRSRFGHMRDVIIEIGRCFTFILIAMFDQKIHAIFTNLLMIRLTVVQLFGDRTKQTRCIACRMLSIESFQIEELIVWIWCGPTAGSELTTITCGRHSLSFSIENE